MSLTSPLFLTVFTAIAIALVLAACAGGSSLRPAELGFRYVHMNQDGTVRELSKSEKDSISQSYSPGDGSRPYIKSKHGQRNGWGSLSGFIERRRVPVGVSIQSVNPEYSPTPIGQDFLMRIHDISGDRITKSEDGLTVERGSPDPTEAMRLSTEFWLKHERAEEARAKPKNP